MPLFSVVGLDHSPNSMPLRNRLRSKHRAFVKDHDEMLRFAAAMVDPDGNQSGSIYVFEADSIDDVREWTAREPFCQGAIYKELRITELSVGLNALKATDWSS